MSSELLAARTVSAFPLSIGTSLAFESLSQSGGTPYDEKREIPQIVDLKRYDSFWINLSTLFRNLYGSVPSKDAEGLIAQDCSDALLVEMELIEEIIRSETNDSVKVHFFISNYHNLKSLSSQASLRVPNTPKQINYFKLHDAALQIIINTRHTQSQDVHIYENKLKPKWYPKALILTHIAYDLVNFSKFSILELIESHTGILKKRNTWYTKYYQSEDLSMIPFEERLLKFFGDNHTFKPFPIKARKTIAELAIDRRWTWATTESKITADISSLNDQLLAQVIKNL